MVPTIVATRIEPMTSATAFLVVLVDAPDAPMVGADIHLTRSARQWIVPSDASAEAKPT